MKRFTVIACVLLAGCVSIQDLQTEGDRSEYALKQSPRDAAGCMAHNAERYWPGVMTAVRSAGNGVEAVVVQNGPEIVIVYALVAPAPHQGSRVTMRSKVPPFRSGLIPAMVSGC